MAISYRDGAEENWSSNWGVEGPTDDPGIRAMRDRARRNLIATLFLLSMMMERFWCRYLCPLGALLGLISKVGWLRHRVDKNDCIECGRCVRVCPTGTLDPERGFLPQVDHDTRHERIAAVLGDAHSCHLPIGRPAHGPAGRGHSGEVQHQTWGLASCRFDQRHSRRGLGGRGEPPRAPRARHRAP